MHLTALQLHFSLQQNRSNNTQKALCKQPKKPNYSIHFVLSKPEQNLINKRHVIHKEKNMEEKRVFSSLVPSRKTTYEFSNKGISDADLQKILEAMRWSPNAGNIQPWQFIVIENKKNIQRLLDSASFIHFPFINPAPQILLVFILDKRCVENGPFKKEAIPVKMEDSKMCIGMSALQATLQAEALGISSCILTSSHDEIKKFLRLKKEHQVLLFVGLGYGKKEGYQKKRERKPLKEMVSYEYYGNTNREKN